MNIDISQLLQRCGIEIPSPTPIDYPGYVPNLYDVRAAREHQPMMPTEGSLPSIWDEECDPHETWYMGYVCAHVLAEMQYAQELTGTLRSMLRGGTVAPCFVATVLLVVEGLEYQYKPEDIVWYEGRLQDISTKLCEYYSSPATTNKEGAPHEG